MLLVSYDQLEHDFVKKGILTKNNDKIGFNIDTMLTLKERMIAGQTVFPNDDVDTIFLSSCTSMVIQMFNLTNENAPEELNITYQYVMFLTYCIDRFTKFFTQTPVNLDNVKSMLKEMLEDG